MALLLALVGLVLAAVASVLAWRARRASHALALEMIELRDRLAGAERAHRSAQETTALRRGSEATFDPELVQRLTSVEGQLRDLTDSRVDARVERSEPQRASAPQGESVLQGEELRALVRRHLKRRGFERVSFLGTPRDGRLFVEVERSGIISKGHADVAPDGSVHLSSVSSLRAFP